MINKIKGFLISKNIHLLNIVTDNNNELCFNCYVDNIEYKRKIGVVLGEFHYENNYLYCKESNYYNDLVNLEFSVIIKKNTLIQVTPERYVHHITYEGREKKILLEGLKTNKLDDSLVNLPAVYLCNSSLRKDLFIDYFLSYYCVLLRIDTTKCNNTFYLDCNNECREEGRFIMTYENIPPEAITFVQFMDLSCTKGSMNLTKYFREKRTI